MENKLQIARVYEGIKGILFLFFTLWSVVTYHQWFTEISSGMCYKEMKIVGNPCKDVTLTLFAVISW